MCVGLVAVFGRNHGVYGFAGSLGVMLWLYINRSVGPPVTKGLAIWGLGVVAGFMPIVLMALSIPGFANAFIESIRFLIEFKGTNLPLPVPWPWSVDFGSMPIHDAVGAVLVGLFFVAVAGFGTLSAPWITWQAFRRVKVSSALVAASFMGLPYAHYAYSRADPGHLAQGIFPFLIGSLALLAPQSAKLKWPLTLGLCFASLWVMQMHQPGWQCALDGQCVEVKISGNSLLVSPDTAGDIELLRSLAHQYAPNGRSFVATPFWPGAYALLERRSPTWDIYPLFSRSEAFEQAEIARMSSANPGFVLVLDLPLDGREDLRFKNTHPLTHQYIVDNFRRLAESPSENYQIYAERSTSH